MQNVSQEWKDNQNELLTSESFVEISIKLTDPDAYEDASAEDNGRVYFANDTDYVVSEVDKNIDPHTTLERNLWVLDGSRKIVPESDYGENGYIGNVICGANKTFSTNPIVSVVFSEVFHNLIKGITIRWSEVFGEYAEQFIVRAYNGNTMIAEKQVTDNKMTSSVIYLDIVNYDKITVEVVKWSIPYRRARMTEILIGVTLQYSKTDLLSFSHSQEVDPISSSLPKCEVSFSINNVDNSYNPNNLDSYAKYLVERQEIKVRYGYKIGDTVEWIDSGTFYMSEWDAPQNGLSADFTARDLLEFMQDTYYKGTYNANGTSLYDLAISVLTDADLPLDEGGSAKWIIDDSLKNILTVAPLPIDTHANCLQMIANAGGCAIYQDRGGILHIEKTSIGETTDYAITRFNSYSKPDVTLSKPLKQVDVSCYSYSVESEVTELYKGKMSINGAMNVLITYSGTATNVMASVSKGTLNSATYYSNACLLNITGTGEVTITVSGYSLSSSSMTHSNIVDVTGETISVDNPLITDYNQAVQVSEIVGNLMKNRMILSMNWRADPRLDVLDVISNENEYNTNRVLMTNVNYTYNGSFKGDGEGRVV